MNISLTPELEKLLQEKVASGKYTSSTEVISEALHLLEKRDRNNMSSVQNKIALGLQQARAGELHDGDSFFQSLEQIE